MTVGSLPWPTRRDVPHVDFLTLLDRKPWHALARCAHHPSVDYRWFFSERSSGQRGSKSFTDAETKAKVACLRCPVRRECLKDGLYEAGGSWAGTLPFERERHRHLDDCSGGTRQDPRHHTDCRPDDEQVAILLAEMENQARLKGFIGWNEEVV